MGKLPLAGVLATRLLNDGDIRCTVAGLSLFANSDGKSGDDLSRSVAAQLGQTVFPFALCQQVAIALLRFPRTPPDVCRIGLMKLASRANDKLDGVETLRSLKQWVGQSAILDSVCDELESRIRIRCSRCDVSLTPPELAEHVRDEHGLVLVGRRARQPWSVAMECLDLYTENPRSDLLDSAERMAALASPESGRQRLLRESLRRGIAPPFYRSELLDAARLTSQSLCPVCWESISTDDVPESDLWIDAQGNLHSTAISLKRTSLHGIWRGVEIEPWNGPTPSWTLSKRGLVFVVAVVFLIPSVLCLLMAFQGLAAASPAALWFFYAGIAGVIAVEALYWPHPIEPVDAAWKFVVPAMLDHEESPGGLRNAGFVSSLARASCSRGSPVLREMILNQVTSEAMDMAVNGLFPLGQLGELLHLRLVDARTLGNHHDAREDLMKSLLRCVMRGMVPLRTLDDATERGAALATPFRDEAIALLWSLATESIAAGLVPADLVALSKLSATVATLLHAVPSPLQTLSHIFALLEFEQNGRVPAGLTVVPELLSRGLRKPLRDYPTLLAQSLAKTADDTIRLGVLTFKFRDTAYSSLPDVTVKSDHEIVITGTGGRTSFPVTRDSKSLAAELRRFSGFYFQHLKPRADELSTLPTTTHLVRLRAEPVSRCPNCQTYLRLKEGAIATNV